MKFFRYIAAWVLALMIPAYGQIISQTLNTDTNGVIVGWPSFAASNNLALASATAPQQFPLSFSNLTCTIGPGRIIFPTSGQSLVSTGGTIQLFASFTNYLVINYATGNFHSLYRFLGGGGEYLIAVIVTGSTSVSSYYINSSFEALPSRIGQYKAKAATAARVDIALLGDSTTEASGTGVMWKDLLFSASQTSNGWVVPYVTNVTYRNYGLGGMNADYGAAIVSRSAQSMGYGAQGYGTHGWPLDFAGAAGGSAVKTFTPQAGLSYFWKPLPDLAIVGFGINANLTGYGAYAGPDLELIGRALAEANVPTLYITEGDFSGGGVTTGTTAANAQILCNGLGGAIADTAAYEYEVNLRGTNTYTDTIHQNQSGWNAWAEAIKGVLNSYTQRTLTVIPNPNRLIDPPTASEAPYYGLQATFVGGTALNKSSGVTVTNTASTAATYLAAAFGQTTVYSVPGVTGTSTNFVDYAHGCWTSAQLIFERGVGTNGVGTNSFAGYAAWLDRSGNEQVMRTFSFTDDNNPGGGGPYQRPSMLDIASVSQVLPAITNLTTQSAVVGGAAQYWNAGALRVAITSGNARILGVLFRGPRHRKLALIDAPELVRGVAWFDDTLDPFGWYPHMICSDTAGSYFGLRLEGKAAQLGVRGSLAAGQWQVYGNGALIASKDFYGAGQTSYLIQWAPGLTSGTDGAKGAAKGDLLLYYSGANAGQIPPYNGYHGIGIWDALVVY